MVSDMWDSHGDTHYRIHPEVALDELFEPRCDRATISRDGGAWWLDTGVGPGQDRFDTLDDAMIAGDEAMAELHDGQDAALLADAGLDADEWNVRHRGGFAFVRADGGAIIAADQDSDTQRWDAWLDGDDPIATGMGTIAACLDAIAGRARARVTNERTKGE